MKNIIKLTLSVVILLMSTQVGSSQNMEFGYNSAIKFSPASFRNSEFRVLYEKYFVNRKSSITFAPSFVLRDNAHEKKIGYQMMAQYRFYLTHFNKEERGNNFLGMENYGFYSGLYGLFLDYHSDYNRDYYEPEQDAYLRKEFEKNIYAIEGGVLLGVQVDITKRILVDLYVGGGVRYTQVDDTFDEYRNEDGWYDTYSIFDPEYKGVKPVGGFLLGFLF